MHRNSLKFLVANSSASVIVEDVTREIQRVQKSGSVRLSQVPLGKVLIALVASCCASAMKMK
jgi:hypothetical protein